ncbi:MAG TPA: hypothetical protein VHZ24_17530 [Pirellulales bacterium]|jgi:hypothetical protein|nr:hypothetical protein [Pirellulales bacterium]
MSTGNIARVQADLHAMQQALGLGSMWSMTDVRFGYALAGACALLAALRWPGSPLAVAMPWAAVPLLMLLAIWIGYMAVKSRTLPYRELARRREYQFGILVMGCALLASLGYKYWSRLAGLTIPQSGGALLALLGAGTVIYGVAQPAPRRYPRSYCVACGLPTIMFGLALPLVGPEYTEALIGLMGLAAFGAGALAMRHQVLNRLAEEHARVLD